MTWLKQNWFKVGLLTILVIVVAGAFYWYEWRPSQIRKYCLLKVCIKTEPILPTISSSSSSSPLYEYFLRLKENLVTEEEFICNHSISEKEQLYKNCLRGNGLEK